MKFTLTLLAVSLSASTAFSEPSIRAPLTKDQIEFTNQKAPILIQPDFENTIDNLTGFDYDTRLSAKDGKPMGEMTTQDNFSGVARKMLTIKSEALVDWDFIEIGGAISLNFLFHRPYSVIAWGTDRLVDSESAVLAYKKRNIGQNLDVFEMIGWTNAHGAGLFGACPADFTKCLGPNFSAKLGLQKYMVNQANGNGREIARIGGRDGQTDGRAMIVSEQGTHALVLVTDVDLLLKDINIEKAVIYYPEGAAELADLKNKFAGALEYVPYKLRDKEFSTVIRENIAAHLAKKAKPILVTKAGDYTLKSQSPVEAYSKTKIQMMGIPSNFVNADLKSSGANPYPSWGPSSHVDTKGKRGTPSSHEDKNFPRINCPNLGSILVHCTTGFFTPEEIERGADKFIRNNWMDDVVGAPKK